MSQHRGSKLALETGILFSRNHTELRNTSLMTGLRKHSEEGSLPLDARFQYGNRVKVSRVT
ncbi:hypothetical protein ACT0HV_004590, partial [Vibrio diabolicus]